MKKLYFFTCFAALLFICFNPATAQAQELNIENTGIRDFGYFKEAEKEETDHYYILFENNELWRFNTSDYGSSMIATGVKKANPSAGYNFFFIKTDNSLWGWGLNEIYELGVGHNNTVDNPVKILDDVIDVIPAQYYSTYAIKSDNSLWSWGTNEMGQLCNGSQNNSITPQKVFDNVQKVLAGNYMVYFLTTDGKAYVAGDIYRLKTSIFMGDYSILDYEYIATPALAANDVRDIEYGIFYKNDGTVWGYTPQSRERVGYYKNPVKLVNVSNEIHQYWKNGYDYFLTPDKTLWVYGSGSTNYVSGVGLEGEISTPTKVMDNVKWFDGNNVFSLLLNENGELWGWGNGRRLEYLNNEYSRDGNYDTPVKLINSVEEFYNERANFYISKSGGLYLVDYNVINNPTGPSSLSVKHIEIIGPSIGTETAVTNTTTTKVIFNDKELQLPMPINRNNRSFYPFRSLLESIGADVDWIGETNTATATIGENTVEFTINSNSYKVNETMIVMDEGITPFVDNGSTYIPIRYAVEGFGFTVDFNSETNTIIISD